MPRALAIAICAAAVVLVSASSAAAAEPAGKVDLGSVRAQGPVRDTVRHSASARPGPLRAVPRALFTDSKGVAINIDSTVAGYDLGKPAAVLNSTVHGAELAKVTVHVVTLANMATICGDAQALACYLGDARGFGQIWFAADDSDWIHSLVHEYGHHIDNQIANFSQLGAYGYGACSIGSDGTRDWYFERLGGSNTTDASSISCNARDWEHLLPELYAEDFVVLNGIDGWQLSSAKPPNGTQLKAMQYDIDNKLYRATKKYSKTIRHHKIHWRRVNTPVYSLLSVKASGARGRDFDIYVFPATSDDVFAKAAHNGRTERLVTFLYPGKWDIGIRAYGKSGSARIDLRLR
ncbi:MAG: hypothetical protein QM648_11000 [Solirubrobacterales bacterium]